MDTLKQEQKVQIKDSEQSGLEIPRLLTKNIENPLEAVEYENRNCSIYGSDGKLVFEMKNCKIPKKWSQVAADIMISKYFRKAGVPQYDDNGNIKMDSNGKIELGPEKTATTGWMLEILGSKI